MKQKNYIIFIFLTVIWSLFSGKIIISYFKNKEINNAIESQSKTNQIIKNKTPLFGGFMFSIPILIYLLFIKDYKLFIFLITGFLIGLYDDYKKYINKGSAGGLKTIVKSVMYFIHFFIYILLFKKQSLVNINSLVHIKSLIQEAIKYFSIIIGILVTDGIDGLLGSLTIISLLLILILNFKLNSLIILTLFALLPFMFLNFNPAKIFMGDTGSSFLASLLFYCINKSPNKLVLVTPYLIGFISSSLTKTFNKKFMHKAPYHHTLEYYNWSEKEIVSFYILIYLTVIILSLVVLK